VEKIKIIIELLKTIFTILTTAFFSLIAYLFLNYENLSFLKKFVIIYVALLFIVIIVVVMFNIIKLVNKLKE